MCPRRITQTRAVVAVLQEGGLGMGSLEGTQSAHQWNSGIRALQAGGRSGALKDMLSAPGDAYSLAHCCPSTVAFWEIETTGLPSVFLSKIGLSCRSLIPFHSKRDVFPT
jgi:hypothetical protein